MALLSSQQQTTSKKSTFSFTSHKSFLSVQEKEEEETLMQQQIQNCNSRDNHPTTIITSTATSIHKIESNIQMKKTSTIHPKKKNTRRRRNNTTGSTSTITSSATTTSFTGKQKASFRRIQREWKDAVQMGIAYDWNLKQTITKQQQNNTKNQNRLDVRIGPWNKNIFMWHFSFLGSPNSVYEGGVYHGRILLPKDYPLSPPRIQMITPNGRFVTGADICLSASSFHPESWTPRWTVLSLVEALRLHMLTTANEIGGKLTSSEHRQKLAKRSRTWKYYGTNSYKKPILPTPLIDHEQMVKEQGLFPHSTPVIDQITTDTMPTQKAVLMEQISKDNCIDMDHDIQHTKQLSSSSSSEGLPTPTKKHKQNRNKHKQKKKKLSSSEQVPDVKKKDVWKITMKVIKRQLVRSLILVMVIFLLGIPVP